VLRDGLRILHVGLTVGSKASVVIPSNTGVVDKQLDTLGFFLGDLIGEALDFLLVADITGHTGWKVSVACKNKMRSCAYAIMLPGPDWYFSTTLSRASSRRPVMYTLAPLATRACVIMRPIPEPPPVTTAMIFVQSKRLEDSNSLFGWEDMLRVMMKAGRNAVGDLVNADFVMGGAVLKNCRSMPVFKAFVVVGKLCRSIFPHT